MKFLQGVLRHPRAIAAISTFATSYLRFVWRTNRWPPGGDDSYAGVDGHLPAIIAMWHGQHLLVPFVRHADHRSVGLVSKSRDGEIAARILKALDVRAIRGSGAGDRKTSRKGGATALREMLRALSDGETVVLTADVPKTARICGDGIIALARLSGRPIIPVAVATSRFVTAGSWDRASIPLPFGRKTACAGAPIYVGKDMTADEAEAARLAVERALQHEHARAAATFARATFA